MMKDFRNHPLSQIAGVKVVRIDDILLSKSLDCDSRKETPIAQPVSDVLQYFLADGSKVTMRPSGTEPKIKFYFSVREPLASREEFAAAHRKAEAKIDAIIKDLKLE